MMAEKASLFEDWRSREEILRAGTPREQKALGRRATGFEEDAWQARCLDIVAEGNYHKFTQNEDLQTRLLATGGARCSRRRRRRTPFGA